MNNEQFWVFYRGKLCHLFKKNYQPTNEEIYEVIINQGFYGPEVRSNEITYPDKKQGKSIEVIKKPISYRYSKSH